MSQAETTLNNPAQLSTFGQANDVVVPPVGLLYISSVLKKNNFKVNLIDSLGENPDRYYKYNNNTYRWLKPDEIIEKISPETKIIGISCMFSVVHAFVIVLCRLIKTKYPKKIMIGF